ncbi:MAG: hypothetical protein HRT44_10380 [Bdellovibrionales bacterium]|nr:hypothetical protein [Bdellovibrionales bacterium]NQZ19646.1 hypothetical protein [Bdellovibrionales bacterium]
MINLVYDNFKNGQPIPNGLSDKYFSGWEEECLRRNDYNVLTRFIPTERNKMGYFPLLMEKSQHQVNIKSLDQIKEGENNWLVIEPNMLDRSLILENCFGCLSVNARKAIQKGLVKLVIYYAYEAFPLQQCHWMELVERSLGMLQIPPEQVIFVFGDMNLEQNFEQYLRFNRPWFDFTFKSRHKFAHFEFEFQEYVQEVQKNAEESEQQLVVPSEELKERVREKQ